MAEDNRIYRTESNRLARQYPKKRAFGDDVLILSNQSGRFQLTYWHTIWLNGEITHIAMSRRNWLAEDEKHANEAFNTWEEDRRKKDA